MRGTYTLLLHCDRSMCIKFGKLGYAKLKRGYLLYTGSALGNGDVALENRIKRHVSRAKRVRWHVDYVTTHAGCSVKSVTCLNSEKRLECLINCSLTRELTVEPVLSGLGSTDCNCDAHLLSVISRMNSIQIRNALDRIYARFGRVISFSVSGGSRSVVLHPTFSKKRL